MVSNVRYQPLDAWLRSLRSANLHRAGNQEPSYLFGLLGGGEHTEWIKIQGIPAFAELFQWMTVIIEMYFGATLARRA